MLKLKNIIFSIGFLFRPMTPVAVSFAFLVLTCVLLVVIILNLNESTKVYQVLLSILTGVTASLLIAIMMELYNNYRFNTKRQRELREYFRQVASYELNQSSIIETNAKDEYDSVLGSGRSYAVFSQLKDIIPNLREVLNHRDYLYRLEIEEIDDILSDYEDLVKIIWVELFGPFLDLVCDNTGTNELEAKDEGLDEKKVKLKQDKSEHNKFIDESISDYSMLFNFLEKEAANYYGKEKDAAFYEEAPKQLESIIEKAIFLEHHIFRGYFEVTDVRFELVKTKDDEEEQENDLMLNKNKRFEHRSNMISCACGKIDEAMARLQKRVTKEPYFWVVASYREKKR
jgi:hypothetical protein